MRNAPRRVPGTPDGPAADGARFARLRTLLDIMVRDGGLVRLLLPNRHRVAEGVWRSGQPGPRQLRAFARAGGRTVISFRAGRDIAAVAHETASCRAHGLRFHTLPLRGHRLPSPDELRRIAALFAVAHRPVLLHCQYGADRAGLAAALWLLLVEGRDVAEARRQLSPRFGHNPFGRAGLLDALLDAYAAETRGTAMPLAEWIETAYDPERITAAWRASSPVRRVLCRLGLSARPARERVSGRSEGPGC